MTLACPTSAPSEVIEVQMNLSSQRSTAACDRQHVPGAECRTPWRGSAKRFHRGTLSRRIRCEHKRHRQCHACESHDHAAPPRVRLLCQTRTQTALECYRGRSGCDATARTALGHSVTLPLTYLLRRQSFDGLAVTSAAVPDLSGSDYDTLAVDDVVIRPVQQTMTRTCAAFRRCPERFAAASPPLGEEQQNILPACRDC